MKLNGIRDIFSFLNMLEERRIFYRLDHNRSDAIMVSFTLLGARVELEFFDGHIEYSVFSGDESVSEDQAALFTIINDFKKG